MESTLARVGGAHRSPPEKLPMTRGAWRPRGSQTAMIHSGSLSRDRSKRSSLASRCAISRASGPSSWSALGKSRIFSTSSRAPGEPPLNRTTRRDRYGVSRRMRTSLFKRVKRYLDTPMLGHPNQIVGQQLLKLVRFDAKCVGPKRALMFRGGLP